MLSLYLYGVFGAVIGNRAAQACMFGIKSVIRFDRGDLLTIGVGAPAVTLCVISALKAFN